MTKIKKTLSFVTVLFMVVTSVEARPVSNYFINGVNNTEREARNSAKFLQQNVSVGEVGYLYNKTFGLITDVIEAAGQTLNLDKFYDSDGNVNPSVRSDVVLYSYLTHPDRNKKTDAVWAALAREGASRLRSGKDISIFFKYIDNHIHYNALSLQAMFNLPDGISLFDVIGFLTMPDLDQVKVVGVGAGYLFNNEYQYYFSASSNEYIDINNMLIELYSGKNQGKNINLIAHSQGNLFANRLLDAFGDPDRVKLLSVATPDSRVYNTPSYLENENYVTLKEDMVAFYFRKSLPKNKTNFSQQEVEESIFYSILTTPEVNNAKYKYIDSDGEEKNDRRAHGFISAYMHQDEDGPSVSKSFITNKFQSNYSFLTSSDNEIYGIGGPGIENDVESINFNDYSVSDISLSKSSVEVGERFYVYVYQHYFGTYEDKELSSSRVGYFCSQDTNWSSDDYYLDYDSSSLGIDDPVHSEKERLEIPNGKCSDEGYILAVANYDDRISEEDKTNNVVYASLSVQQSGSSGDNDIYLGSTRIYDSSLYRGQEVKVKTNVCYRGSSTKQELGSVKTAYWLVGSSFAEVLETDSSTIGTDDECDGESEYITIPESISKGSYKVIVSADYQNQKDDIDLANNIKILNVDIR